MEQIFKISKPEIEAMIISQFGLSDKKAEIKPIIKTVAVGYGMAEKDETVFSGYEIIIK